MTCLFPNSDQISLLTVNSAFATPQSYRDICGHIKQGKQIFIKCHAYNTSPESHLGIVTQRDPARHRVIRKSLSHTFSAKALRAQTDVVLKYVDMWVAQIKEHGDSPEGINVDEVCEVVT
jgi:cytochrome P450